MSGKTKKKSNSKSNSKPKPHPTLNVNDVIIYILLHNQKRDIPITHIKIWTGAGTNSNDPIKPYDPSRESFAKVRLILKYLKRLGLTLSKPHKMDACYAEIVS